MTRIFKQMVAILWALIFASVSTVVQANGGTGNGDGDGVFGYQSDSDSAIVRKRCMNIILTNKERIDNGWSMGSAPHELGICLMNTREDYKNRPPYMRNNSTCRMLDYAAAEGCSGHWGLFGLNHQGCVRKFVEQVGKSQSWVANIGLCNGSCFSFNPPVISAYPWDTYPCGEKNPPSWMVQLIP